MAEWRAGGTLEEGKSPQPLEILGKEPDSGSIKSQMDLAELRKKILTGAKLSKEELQSCNADLSELYLKHQAPDIKLF